LENQREIVCLYCAIQVAWVNLPLAPYSLSGAVLKIHPELSSFERSKQSSQESFLLFVSIHTGFLLDFSL